MLGTSNAINSPRYWELSVGDHFRGRTIASIKGMVGFANNPVEVIFFSDNDMHPAKVPATYSETMLHSDEMARRARQWVKHHGLREGDPIDITLLRSELTGAPMEYKVVSTAGT